MGTGPSRGPSGSYGSLTRTEAVLDTIGRDTLVSLLEPILFRIIPIAFPKIGAAIIAGYCLYKFGKKLKSLKQEYDLLEGSPVNKITQLAIREGFKVGLAKIGNAVFDAEVKRRIGLSVHTTTSLLSRHGVFREIVRGIGAPANSEQDLRDFFAAAAERVLEAAYSGVKGEIIDYVGRGVVP